MNLRHYSIAVLISALPIFAAASSHGISLGASDFVSAEKIAPNGETIMKMKLSKSGKAKFKKLNGAKGETPVVHSKIAGVVTDFKLRAAIQGEDLDMGPLSRQDKQPK